ncbi:hypothetical protein AC578_3607 [Pseudocercospora eumusae]|uniref:Alpha N-terminal protein methyltransferase 1 n=1 Tax=Pseudocercospora eumusae TaxID=321146 RepID=A0A139HPU8_9PEZI|nr:hypothetical protein AC578_3607 [Pseudocercospora eumusae]
MSSSPKRKLSAEKESSPKKARNGDIEVIGINGANGEHENNSDLDLAEEISMISPSALPDSNINHAAAIAYWSSTPATVDGVLGGFPQVSRVDLQGSANFLAKLRRQSKVFSPSTGKLKRVADCGAGIGRVTTGFLRNVAETVDIIEPVKAFTDQIENDSCVGKIYNVGLEQWQPETKYDVVWNQWCVGQLTDAQLVAYMKSLPQYLNPGGWIVVKENLSNHHSGEDVFDEVDSSVTRTDVKFRQLFNEAGLHVVSTELQKGFPKTLYPVRAYALQPR